MDAKEWLNNNELSYTIWNNKYRYKDENLDEWLDRVSGGNKQVRDLIKDKKFLFGGRILANRGLDKFGKKVTYSNCYVIERPEDNIESIFECGAKLARTYSYGGGCGIDVSNLRPKNAIVNNAADTTSGSTSFMDFFSYITGLIGQSGRRGALMISISDTHPDLSEFINLKSDLNICTKANISVRVSDDFMHAVDGDLDWKLYFKTEHEEIERTVKAREIFHLLAQRNWEMAEPGILYWDNIRNHNMLNTDPDFEYAGVNPCAR
jgi:ribonucleoside-diphosphate reductase alpha chain